MGQILFNKYPTPIQYYDEYKGNNIYIKRDDLTEPTLGGNKVRKLELFLAEAKEKKANYIITYGAAQSNHCRLTVSMANKLGFKVLLILAKSDEVHYNGNFLIYDLYDTKIVWTETDQVSETIELTLRQLKSEGHLPYFIQGGGHGNLGTHAYKLAFDEILKQEIEMNVNFNTIFHASGTGTTQAGLIVGNKINDSNKEIVGISVARNKERGTEVIEESIHSYFENKGMNIQITNKDIIFSDQYVGEGYADIYPQVISVIKLVAKRTSVLLDPVYTGKAFYGMLKHIEKNEIRDSNILFIHTGGIPLLFNYASTFKEE